MTSSISPWLAQREFEVKVHAIPSLPIWAILELGLYHNPDLLDDLTADLSVLP